MLHKKKSLKIKTKQKHITYMSLFLKKAIIGIFEQLSLSICKPGAIYGRKSNYFILTFLLQGCLVYQIYQVQYLQSYKPDFWGYKIIKWSTRYGRSTYRESIIKYSFLKSYGKFKMCFTCATYTDLSL